MYRHSSTASERLGAPSDRMGLPPFWAKVVETSHSGVYGRTGSDHYHGQVSVCGRARSAGRSIDGGQRPRAGAVPAPDGSVERCGRKQIPAAFDRGLRFCLLLLASVLVASACGGEDEPELTLEDRLEIVEGRPLTAVEVADRLSVASALCEMDEPILNAVWRRLTEEQLEFQDFVFAHICPDRSVFYAGLTGRYVTEEAENSGVVTSTTPPIRTTTTVGSDATVTTAGPLSSGDANPTTAPVTDGDTPGDSPDPDPETDAEGSADNPETSPETDATATTTAPVATTVPDGEGG